MLGPLTFFKKNPDLKESIKAQKSPAVHSEFVCDR